MRYSAFVLLLLAGCSSKVVPSQSQSAATKPAAVVKSAPAEPLAPAPPSRGGLTSKKAPDAKTYTREEFKTLLVGKTEDQVKSVLGEPNATGKEQEQSFWKYDRVTHDPVTGQPDPAATVWWKEGKVERVSYQGAAAGIP